MAYTVDYDDERFTDVENDRKAALTEVEKTYGDMIDASDKFYQDQIAANQEFAETQKKNQQALTDFNIQKIEQQKEQAHKDYIKEQSGAFVDYKKASNQYGAQAEAMAAQGLERSGFSESSQVAMYNQYQNRVAVARQAAEISKLNFENNIQQALLQHNSLLAEIALTAHQKELELALQGFQSKNQLIKEQSDRKMAVENRFDALWQNVLQQINTEKAFEEQQRQFNESLAFQKEQFAWQKAQDASPGAYGGYALIDKYNTGYEVDTPYYQGNKAENVGGYGYFSNGYQPKAVYVGNKAVQLKNSGATYTFNTQTRAGQSQSVTQTVWQAGDRYFYWEGRENKYKELWYNEKTGQFQRTSPNRR